MFKNNLFFGYASFEDFTKSEHLASTENFLRFLSITPQDEIIKMSGHELKIIDELNSHERATLNNPDFILSLLNKVSVHDRVAKIYGRLACYYHEAAFYNFNRENYDIDPSYMYTFWIFPSHVLNSTKIIDQNCSNLNKVLTGLCEFIHIMVTSDDSCEYTDQEINWFKLIKSVNLDALKSGFYRRDFPTSLITILDSIILETPQDHFNEQAIRDLHWMNQTRKLDSKIAIIDNKYSIRGLDIQYDILAIDQDPQKYTMQPIDIICETISNVPYRYLETPNFGMYLVEVFNAVHNIMCDINTTAYAWTASCKSLPLCNQAIQKVIANRSTGEYNGPDSIDFNESANESALPVYTQPIDYLDRWSFDYISGDEIEVATESYDDEDETEVRRHNREKRDELNTKRRRQSEKLRSTGAKIYRGYKTYKDNEEKVDSQLTSITKAIGQKVVGLETDKIRDEVIEGKKITVIGTLKKALGTVGIFSVNKMAGLIAVVTHFYLHDRVTNKERKRVCLELEAEIEIVNEKIEDARADGNRKAKYDLMRTKNNLEVALRKIKSKADSSHNSAIGEAKSLVRRNRNS